jgi:hypothetical protein
MKESAEGFIAPCLYGGKEKKFSYMIFNENEEEILIRSHVLPRELIDQGGRVRLFGNLLEVQGVKEMNVESYLKIDRP